MRAPIAVLVLAAVLAGCGGGFHKLPTPHLSDRARALEQKLHESNRALHPGRHR